jgi:hypothetical protein
MYAVTCVLSLKGVAIDRKSVALFSIIRGVSAETSSNRPENACKPKPDWLYEAIVGGRKPVVLNQKTDEQHIWSFEEDNGTHHFLFFQNAWDVACPFRPTI